MCVQALENLTHCGIIISLLILNKVSLNSSKKVFIILQLIKLQ
jgi:hypothetical protein